MVMLRYDLPVPEDCWEFDLEARRMLRDLKAMMSGEVQRLKGHTLGPLLRLERNHHFGIVAVYRLDPTNIH
jgi:hypothetical protein